AEPPCRSPEALESRETMPMPTRLSPSGHFPRPASRPAAWVLLLLIAAAVPVAAGAQESRRNQVSPVFPQERVAVHAYTPRHRTAAEAAAVVVPLLSDHGAVTVQEESNTVVVRDTVGALTRIAPALRAFDRPRQPLALEMMVVRAANGRHAHSLRSTAPPEVARQLARHVRYDVYQLVGRAELETAEGEEVTYEVGGGYTLRFRVGDLGTTKRLKLHDFRVFQNGREEAMLRVNLLLTLDHMYILGLAKSEESPTALMLVLTCRRPAPARAGDR
ncbi:MAG TPA: secretin N-terminal domain-containing protein, partial [Thermoanaerobaculia bacterium]|nr:secretin N-terminal domain-containing protein [Thermoanaerobaculia bacterium]